MAIGIQAIRTVKHPICEITQTVQKVVVVPNRTLFYPFQEPHSSATKSLRLGLSFTLADFRNNRNGGKTAPSSMRLRSGALRILIASNGP